MPVAGEPTFSFRSASPLNHGIAKSCEALQLPCLTSSLMPRKPDSSTCRPILLSQCYDKYMMAKLTKAAEARNHPDWAHGPEDAGETAFPRIPRDSNNFVSAPPLGGGEPSVSRPCLHHSPSKSLPSSEVVMKSAAYTGNMA
jgi:hypothetical protein